MGSIHYDRARQELPAGGYRVSLAPSRLGRLLCREMGHADRMIQIASGRDGCRDRCFPLGFSLNRWMLSQVLLDHDHEGQGEMERLISVVHGSVGWC
jgi:hypothetical protein